MGEVKKTRKERLKEHAARLAQHGITPPEDGDLTDRWVDRGAKVAPFSYTVGDRKQTGLALRVAPSGKKTWVLQTAYPGARFQARRKLGVYCDAKGRKVLGLKAAREKAAAWLALVENDEDPKVVAEEARRAKQQERLAKALRDKQTFGAFAEKYISERTNRRKEADKQEIRRTLISEWAERPIHEITARDVRELMNKLVQRGPYDAKNAFGHCTTIFKAAVAEELIPVSPLASVDKKALFRGKIKPRQRALKDEELRAFWSATGQLGTPYTEFFRLLLLTGVRLNELARAKWTELDPGLRKVLADAKRAATPINWQTQSDKIKILVVPRERFKSDREHKIQLSQPALDIIAKLPRGEYLFSATGGKSPINGLSKSKKRLDVKMLQYLREAAVERDEDPKLVRLEPFVLHDLRRTVRTNLAELHVRYEVAEFILGHSLTGLAKTYDIHGREPEQREALEAWAARVREIVSPPPPAPTVSDKVTNLAERRKAKAS